MQINFLEFEANIIDLQGHQIAPMNGPELKEKLAITFDPHLYSGEIKVS
jgi:hypothetical protein